MNTKIRKTAKLTRFGFFFLRTIKIKQFHVHSNGWEQEKKLATCFFLSSVVFLTKNVHKILMHECVCASIFLAHAQIKFKKSRLLNSILYTLHRTRFKMWTRLLWCSIDSSCVQFDTKKNKNFNCKLDCFGKRKRNTLQTIKFIQ